MQTLFDLQYNYGQGDGTDYMIYSLSKMRDRGSDMLCPSHGRPFGETAAGLLALETKFRDYMAHR